MVISIFAKEKTSVHMFRTPKQTCLTYEIVSEYGNKSSKANTETKVQKRIRISVESTTTLRSFLHSPVSASSSSSSSGGQGRREVFVELKFTQ